MTERPESKWQDLALLAGPDFARLEWLGGPVPMPLLVQHLAL